MRVITMGSLFDGIGGFPLAAIHNGVVPLWASEIEAFPIRVTAERLPGMLHYGDITKLRGGRAAARGHYLRRQPLSGLVRGWSEGGTCR